MGSRNAYSQLTETQVRKIIGDSRKISEIAYQYHVTEATIHRIKSGKIWRYVSRDNLIPCRSGRKLNLELARSVRLEKDMTLKQIAQKYGITEATASRVINHKIWKEIE
jgi:DNA-binding Xre family transcriptional regulator